MSPPPYLKTIAIGAMLKCGRHWHWFVFVPAAGARWVVASRGAPYWA